MCVRYVSFTIGDKKNKPSSDSLWRRTGQNQQHPPDCLNASHKLRSCKCLLILLIIEILVMRYSTTKAFWLVNILTGRSIVFCFCSRREKPCKNIFLGSFSRTPPDVGVCELQQLVNRYRLVRTTRNDQKWLTLNASLSKLNIKRKSIHGQTSALRTH